MSTNDSVVGQSELTADGMPVRRRIQVDHYDYNVGVDDEEDFAGALKLSATERMNHLLMDQIEDIESRLADVQESAVLLKRKIGLVEAEAKDSHQLLAQREETSQKLLKDLEVVHSKLETVLSKRSETESERRKYEQRIAILETELENNNRAENKLEKTLAEIDSLKKQAKQLVIQNGDLQQLADRQVAKQAELEKQVKEDQLESRLNHNKQVDNIEKQIISERQRGQDIIDENRKQLKAKISVLEASIQDFQKTGLDANREMRKLERNLKSALRKKEEQNEQLARDARRIESLERQLERATDQTNKIQFEVTELETQNYGKKREVDTLGAQYQAALWVNKKLNDELPVESRIYVWDPNTQPLDETTKPTPKPTPQQPASKPAAQPATKPAEPAAPKAKFDTAVDLSDVDVNLKGVGAK